MIERTRIALVLHQSNINRMVGGITAFVRPDRDYWLVDPSRPAGQIRPALRSRLKVGGMVVDSALQPRARSALVRLNIPTVVTPVEENWPRAACVAVDDRAAGEMVARHFLEAGLKSFGFFGMMGTFSDLRGEGFATALARAGHVCSVYSDNMRRPVEAAAYWAEEDVGLRQWLEGLPKPVGILAAHDPLGRAAIEVSRVADLRVPEDVAVVGVNDQEVCSLSYPPLSSVRIAWEQMGAEIGRLLSRIMAGKQTPAKPILVPPLGIVSRQSSQVIAVGDAIVAEAVRFIQGNFHTGITVADVVRAVPTSRRDLERRFRRTLGCTPRDQIVRAIVNRARQLLAETDLQMPKIAEQCGLAYADRMAILFTKRAGMTPTAYRQRYRVQRR